MSSILKTQVSLCKMEFKIKNNPIKKVYDTPSEIKDNCIRWLSRIGVNASEVYFDYIRSEAWAEVIFILKGREYKFRSNLKAIELFLHSRVINIERGIEEFEGAFGGYALLEAPKNYFSNCETLSELEKRKKELSKKLHPDNLESGDSDDFKEMMRQYVEAKTNL